MNCLGFVYDYNPSMMVRVYCIYQFIQVCRCGVSILFSC